MSAEPGVALVLHPYIKQEYQERPINAFITLVFNRPACDYPDLSFEPGTNYKPAA